MWCISLWQPWASLMVNGAKQIETRSWPLPERYWGQWIALHAAKKWDSVDVSMAFPTRIKREVLFQGLGLMTLDAGVHGVEAVKPHLPFGALVGVGRLVECRKTGGTRNEFGDGPKYAPWVHQLSAEERAFGNYAPERFGWVFEELRALPEPIPYKGQQGLFKVDVPELAALAEGRG